MAEFLHPSVSSKITDNSVVYVTAQGVTQLFAAFTSDIGPDNKINMITSASEFEFHYGKPNMKNHGQAGYNIMNWLQSNGGLYALRVMPENAGYAHAIVNVQAKAGTKQVKNLDGGLVDYPNVEVRPVLIYTGVNNTSEEALKTELSRRDRPQTIDGFESYPLFAVYPKGRGKGYNNLGFRLTLSDSFDDTFDFRVYNLEVTKTTQAGATEIIEGPFSVSLDPEAQALSGESMHISYVIEKYSEYFSVLFNETAYDELGELINPHVNPGVLDFISLKTRELNSGTETYFDSSLSREIDIHASAHKYVNGEPSGEVNMVDVDSAIEQAIVNIDDAARLSIHNIAMNSVSTMRMVLSKVKKGDYGTVVNAIVDSSTGTLSVVSNELIALKTSYDSSKAAYAIDATNDNLNALDSGIKLIVAKVKEMLNILYNSLDTALAVTTSPAMLDLLVDIQKVEAALYAYQIKQIKSASHLSKLIDAGSELELVSVENDIQAKLAQVYTSILTTLEATVFVTTVASEDEVQADAAILELNTLVENATAYYNNATNLYSVADDIDADTLLAVNTAKTMLAKAQDVIEVVMIEVGVETVETQYSDITDYEVSVVTALNDAATLVAGLTTDEAKLAQYEVIEGNIDTAGYNEIVTKEMTFDYKLHNYNSFVPMMKGDDGDLEISNPTLREETMTRLLVEAFTGQLDNDLVNKKLFPIDLVLDAAYPVAVKDAIVQLCTTIRTDFMGMVDTLYPATPQQAIDFKKSLAINNFRVALYTQDFIIHDSLYTGRDIKVTPTYFLASKIPAHDEQFGIHYPLAGNKYGNVGQFETMSFNPNDVWKEELYKNQVNYIEADNRRTRFGTQLTTQSVVSALSNVNNVRALLRIQRDVENMMEDFQFEWNDSATWNLAQYNLNGYLAKWKSNRACESIKGTVYASEYDRQNKILRVKVEMVFNSIIERVLISLVVNK